MGNLPGLGPGLLFPTGDTVGPTNDSTRSLLSPSGSDRAGRFQPSVGPQTLLFTFCLPSPDRVPEAYPVPIRWEAGNRGWFSESEWPSGKHLTMISGNTEIPCNPKAEECLCRWRKGDRDPGSPEHRRIDD